MSNLPAFLNLLRSRKNYIRAFISSTRTKSVNMDYLSITFLNSCHFPFSPDMERGTIQMCCQARQGTPESLPDVICLCALPSSLCQPAQPVECDASGQGIPVGELEEKVKAHNRWNSQKERRRTNSQCCVPEFVEGPR